MKVISPVEQHNRHGLDPKGQSESSPSYQFGLHKEEPCNINNFSVLSIMSITCEGLTGKKKKEEEEEEEKEKEEMNRERERERERERGDN
jgi:hypothetical protein